MLTVFPKLRHDLVLSRQDTPDGPTCVVKDPVTRRFFRLGNTEYEIARQLDGSTSLETLAHQLGAELSVETLEQFVEQLRRLQLLESDRRSAPEPRPFHKRLAGSPLYVRLKAFDPDRLLDRMVGKLAFLFTRTFVALSAAAVVIALGITFASWDEIARDVGRLYRFDALLLAWIVVLLVTTAHEFAHGLTCKHFGGEVHEIGFLLLYFQPAFYCNISDAWLFPAKSQRLWVTFAGAHLDIVVWAVGTMIWAVTEPDTWISFVALIVMATSAVKTFFNLNPLIKLDGYYLLTDLLGVPNLRQRSIDYLKAVVGRVRSAGGREIPATTRRERWIYLTYGLLAGTYSVWLLTVIALHFGGYLVDQYQAPGFVAFSGLIMVMFRTPLTAIARGLPAPLRRSPVDLSRLKRPAVRAAGLILLLAALFLVRLDLKVSGTFTVRPVRNADVRAAVDGIIEQVYVEEGDRVRAGDLLLRLSERDYRVELEKIDAAILEKRAMLAMLQAGPRGEEIAVSREAVATATTRHVHARQRLVDAESIRGTRLSKAEASAKAAEERLQYSRRERDRSEELFAQGLISRKQLDDAEQEVALRQRELEVAEAERLLVSEDRLGDVRQELAVTATQMAEANGKLKLLLAGTRPEAIDSAQAEIARLETERRYVMQQLRLTTVVSPATGVVTTPKLKERVGEQVRTGDLILKVFEMDTLKPEIAVPEKEIAEVQRGQRVVLRARAYPGRTFSGTVDAIAPAGTDDTALARKVFRVTVAMDAPSDLLRAEMTGHAKISCGSRPLGQILTRRIARYLRVEFWSWW